MKGRKHNQQGGFIEFDSWAGIPEEWIPDLNPVWEVDSSAWESELIEWDFPDLGDWEMELIEWDFKLPGLDSMLFECWEHFPVFDDIRKGAESLANKGQSKGKGENISLMI
jgi:hypothetical protein